MSRITVLARRLAAAALLGSALTGVAAGAAIAAPATAAKTEARPASRGFTAADLVTLNRVSEPALSPDGKWLAYVMRETDMAANKGRTDLFVLDLTAKGAEPRRIAADATSDSAPQWSSDGQHLFFLSSRSGSSQVWRYTFASGMAQPVTSFPVDVGGYHLSPAGDRIAFWADVFPDCKADLECTASRHAEKENNPETGRTYDQLFIRHWDTWADGTRSQLFTVALSDAKASGPVALVSQGLIGDTPSKPFGGGEEITFSPDGKTLYFALREAGRIEPLSTNLDIFAAPADGSAAPRNLTDANDATDTHPRVSPDGKTLAYLAMQRPGFEADQLTLMLMDLATGQTRALTGNWDRSIASFEWKPDGTGLIATAGDVGKTPLFLINANTGRAIPLYSKGTVSEVAVGKKDIVFSAHTLSSPADFFRFPHRGVQAEQITQVNKDKLADVAMGEYEQFSFKGWNGEDVYGYLIKPANFDPSKKYPVAYLIHGGPQSTFGNDWNYRWNRQVFAGAGYAVITVDFHGSTGYGQAFTDSITGDWGGKPFEDIQKGWAAALAKYPFLDGNRACALGGSYGGYMMNWIAGNWPDGFSCIVNHAGIFDNRHMAYATEELWFTEWEHGNKPYHDDPDAYEKFNPVHHVKNWQTPMLVIHGEKDFRVLLEEGIKTFTALQRRNIPSRLVVFPDENHWVLKPANSIQWNREVLEWLNRWTSGETPKSGSAATTGR
ncbi:MAG TPA: S9 family peptidase [Pedomonas sp.]|uniref:S9 family peptidase n=1 Tax=Pedomonas sp. TaxID=2976421 RepID=UPI002F42A588